ncbi:SIR2 family protein [Niveispirillum sp. BGYR6]|uniref:SIR2 family NAD-dependent protein deacylase n=1 Tax=Niveispirillum sp. BGYR6 TaxID=2971249 RepID=UPI0022B9781F|nr:SIR2 family protein [Niveispirillum sp. BGYR6]MDG5496653.1 SIR2 family protein [Niveispirillum sp. BGYR6]
MTDWPIPLVRDIARRRCVLVIGSGVSRQSRGANGELPPTWENFLNDCNDSLPNGPKEHIKEAIEQGDLLHACEWLQRIYDSQWPTKLRSVFSAPRFVPSDVHKNICRLDSRVIFSLNFDDIIDRAAQEIYSGTCVRKIYDDPDVSEFLRGTERYLVKVHGTLDNPGRLIFTQKQYASARVKASAFYNAFDSALMTHTFLFLGAGYRDPDINLILENQNFTYAESHPHYFVTANDMHDDLKNSLRANRNLQIISYDKIDENHSGFANAISELYTQVEDYRKSLLVSWEW